MLREYFAYLLSKLATCAFLAGVGVLGYQCFRWARGGTWLSLSLIDALLLLDMQSKGPLFLPGRGFLKIGPVFINSLMLRLCGFPHTHRLGSVLGFWHVDTFEETEN
jgi:hypothetical protein